jgi:hypothetical protein
MREVIVIAEGQTEEQFIKRLIAPSLRRLQVFVKPQLLRTSKDSKGGAITFDRLRFNARNTLRSKSNLFLTTFIDLYALDTDFPRFDEANKKADLYDKVNILENALYDTLMEQVGFQPPDRFIPYIQPYEFEGLLFSDIEAQTSVEPSWINYLIKLKQVRNEFETPEHINQGYATKPSKRLEDLLKPTYHKTRHGPLAAERITLSTIELECRHFREWMDKLRGLTHIV